MAMRWPLAGAVITAIVLTIIPQVESYAYYQQRIPNGDRVPHPCKPNYVWHGVGHEEIAGGGVRNPFGKDFATNGFQWDSCICETDSDGDGKTNGEELGDPLCEWSEGDTPKKTAFTELSHPGVCEPLDDPECISRNNWNFCDYDEFSCKAFNDPAVKNITLRFPPTEVPAQETTYMCMAFALPDDADYHVIGNLAVIDNPNVMHHIVTRGCASPAGEGLLETLSTPQPCDMIGEMISSICNTNLGGWTVGLQGKCLDDAYGYKIGLNGVRVLVHEIHWNNPEKKSNYIDSSGLTIMYTDKLRPNDATGLAVGTLALEIPPGVRSHVEVGHCSSDCTRSVMTNPMYIPEIQPHMHYLGRGMIVEQWRNGELYQELVNESNYRYDSPRPFAYDPPIEVLPGDSLKVQCEFSTVSETEFTFFGQGTYDEMCVALMTVYPVNPDFVACMSFGEESLLCGRGNVPEVQGCNHTIFFAHVFPSHVSTMAANCDHEGKQCYPTCKSTIQGVIDSHPCYEGDHLNVIRFLIGRNPRTKPVLKMMSSCNEYPDDSADNTHSHEEGSSEALCPVTGTGATFILSSLLIPQVAVVIVHLASFIGLDIIV